ncbi:hypothetical protein H4582DRAFT_1919943 [Lactarius indigo]|nr:hypothetical protein H4582DRAFT_1919943 [Lactarius indigo]
MSSELVANEHIFTEPIISTELHDSPPPPDPKSVLLSVQKDGHYDGLDALSLLPHLLPSAQDGTDELLAVIAHQCSAKEVMVAAQEVVEHLRSDAGEAEDVDNLSEGVNLAVQFARITSLFAKAIPRLVLRKSPSQTLAPLAELEQFVSTATKSATVAESRSLLRGASLLVQELGTWVQGRTGDDTAELTASYVILTSFLDRTLEACADLIQSYVAQRAFEACFPRLSVRSVIPGDWKDGQDVVLLAVGAFGTLGRPLLSDPNPNLASLVLIAHALAPNDPNVPLLVSAFPAILTSIQSNIALDASLAILLKVPELPGHIIIPLTTFLPSLCSVHPDASTRHIAFRILARVLQIAPPMLRLQVLRDLISPSEGTSPHMRSAAIGLVKESVLEALSHPNRENVFASPFLLQTIGPYIFRLDSSDLLTTIDGADASNDSPELARLVECLGLYYILLLRDVENRTGIKDPGTIRSVESSLLGPIRSALGECGKNSGTLPLAALQIALERAEDALVTTKIANS